MLFEVTDPSARFGPFALTLCASDVALMPCQMLGRLSCSLVEGRGPSGLVSERNRDRRRKRGKEPEREREREREARQTVSCACCDSGRTGRTALDSGDPPGTRAERRSAQWPRACC